MLLGLSSCAVYENKFDCPPGKGANCSSVEEIEQMVNNGGVWKVNGKVKVAKQKKRLIPIIIINAVYLSSLYK
jgi:hypothetical protein